MGDSRVIDQEFIEGLGRKIDNAATDSLPSARNLAREAQDLMTEAGQAGGLLVVLAYFFASEYVEQAWETKRETATELSDAAQVIARNWRDIEERNTMTHE
ncbi:hypothetical protein [Actinopolymorpha alba]|uniref:hypothetical protein n=1 Tax=Actinopolymorpha alba TaxID=533267 RepID=UPI00036B43AA|nr:hypothetical protein [Actinopolymorpha alba]